MNVKNIAQHLGVNQDDLDAYLKMRLRMKVLKRKKMKEKCSSNMDISNKHRIYKNRLENAAVLLREEILDFDDLFRKKYNTYHCGEINAFLDMIKTRMAVVYNLGVIVGRENLEPEVLSEKRL